MTEPTDETPSAWAMEQAMALEIYCDCGCRAQTTCHESLEFVAKAIDAAELRGHTRAVVAHLAAVEAERGEARRECAVALDAFHRVRIERDEARRERDEAIAQVAEMREHVGSLHKATARGMDHERAAVVAWLRGWGSVGRVATADDYADAIERGDHMETP